MPTSPTPPRELTPEDQALADSLAGYARTGFLLARNIDRLAEVEAVAIEAHARAQAAADRAILDPSSLAEARQAGQDYDDCKAERAAVVAADATLVGSYDKAGRNIRRSITLRARLLAGRPFRPLDPPTPGHDPSSPDPGPAPRTTRDEGVDRPDRSETGRPETAPNSPEADSPETDSPETGDEPRLRPIEQAVQTIDHELSDLTASLAAGPDSPARPRTRTRTRATWQYSPGLIPLTAIPPPDT